MLYPFGLHRLPAQPHQSRSTGHGNAWTHSDSTGADETPAPETETDGETRRQRQRQSRPEIKARSRTPEEPEPARRQQRRQDRQQTPSPTRAAEIETETESQKRGTVDHGRRRTETEREEERIEERERRENDSKTTLFSPSHRTPSRSTARASPAPADMESRRNAAFFRFCFCGVCGTNGDQRLFCYLHRGGWVYIFTPSATPKIWLCTLFSTPLSFSPNHHLPNTPFINDIFPYKYKYPLLQSSLRKNALINAVSSSSELHTKIYFHNFLLRNMP